MFRFLTICVFVFLVFHLCVFSSVNVPTFGSNSVSEYVVNSKNKNLVLEILIDSNTIPGNYSIVNSSKSTAKVNTHFTFGNTKNDKHSFTVTKGSNSFLLYLIVSDTTPKSKIKLELLDSLGLVRGYWDINITKGYNDLPYEEFPIRFSLGYSYIPSKNIVDPSQLYFDLYYRTLDLKGFYLDFGIRQNSSKYESNYQNLRYFKEIFIPEFFASNDNGYRQIPIKSDAVRTYSSSSISGWIDFAKNFENFKDNGVTYGIGIHYLVRSRNLNLNTKVTPDKEFELVKKDSSSPEVKVPLKEYNEYVQRTVNEHSFGALFFLNYNSSDCAAYFKIALSRRVQTSNDNFNISDFGFNSDVKAPQIFDPEAFKAYTVTQNYKSSYIFQAEFLEKTYGFKIGGEVRGIYLANSNPLNFLNINQTIIPDVYVYIAKDFSLKRLAEIILGENSPL